MQAYFNELMICGVPLALYLIGSVPFGLLLTRAAGLGDIRTIGSGNIGATNVLRTGNKRIALLTLLFDFMKGFVPVYVLTETKILFDVMMPFHPIDKDFFGMWAGPYSTHLSFYVVVITYGAAIPVLLGHMFPIWLRFRGGKGVATLFGCAFAMNWLAGLCFAAGWLVMFALTRISSLGAVVGMPVGLLLFRVISDSYYGTLLLALPVMMMVAKHLPNIRRLLMGTEPAFGKKPLPPVAAATTTD
ncbi:MAG: acyl-phosphate glycerol 3-phosphate acyltransferase [Rickettsiales bacterium]|nr:acyl-phosphate glycerol 3-phosphate acyltransferase [Rickettsiales bacterium]|tara:strand:- start:289 stop:1023 length:735 start_codon:yes stop_codon:yes gene_type:complete